MNSITKLCEAPATLHRVKSTRQRFLETDVGMAPLVDELHSVKAPGSTLVTAVGTCPSPTQPIGLRDTGSAFWNDKLQSIRGRQIFIVLVFTAPSLFCLNLPKNPVRNGRCQRTPTAARLNQGNITAVRTVTQDYLNAMGGAVERKGGTCSPLPEQVNGGRVRAMLNARKFAVQLDTCTRCER